MDESGVKALLAFYNQTYHGMTMAAGLRSIGGAFKVDNRLANHMLGNADLILKSIVDQPVDPRLLAAWKRVRDWLERTRRVAASADQSSDVYQLNALAYLTWTKLCNHPSAMHYAEEHYTVFVHPDQHPGVGAIKRIWSIDGAVTASSEPATLDTLASLVARLRNEGPD